MQPDTAKLHWHLSGGWQETELVFGNVQIYSWHQGWLVHDDTFWQVLATSCNVDSWFEIYRHHPEDIAFAWRWNSRAAFIRFGSNVTKKKQKKAESAKKGKKRYHGFDVKEEQLWWFLKFSTNQLNRMKSHKYVNAKSHFRKLSAASLVRFLQVVFLFSYSSLTF